MADTSLEATINAAWEERTSLSATTQGAVRKAVEDALAALDSGAMRVAQKDASGAWSVNQWLKKAVLLSFRLNDMDRSMGAPGQQPGPYWDKVPSKFEGLERRASILRRRLPRRSRRRRAPLSFIAKDAVLMPSFVNIGAYVGEGTMVDTWATVGSCAQIGKHVPPLRRRRHRRRA
jgi:2,3,4,5-tetrahydropyridine-2-carboxylate N-succinyltransferase